MALRDAHKGGKLLVGFGVAGAITAGFVWALRRAHAAESAAGKYKAAAQAASARAASATNAANAAAGRERAALATAEANARIADNNARAAAQNAANAASARADAAQARAALATAQNNVAIAQSNVADAKTAAQAASAREALARAQAQAAQAKAAAATAQAQANARDAAAAKQQADAAAAREAAAKAVAAAAQATLEKQQATAIAQEEARQVEQATAAAVTATRMEEIEEPKPRVTPTIVAPPKSAPAKPKTTSTVTTALDPAKLKVVDNAYVKAVTYAIDEYKRKKGKTLTAPAALALILTAFKTGSVLSPGAASVPAPTALAEPTAYWANTLAVIKQSMDAAVDAAKREVDWRTSDQALSGWVGQAGWGAGPVGGSFYIC